ncbi:MAG: AAA family ATPase [Lachnospiraceae bacterium]|nr:cobyrinic acid a,c-diamide synthase [Lachnospiraceae bacterium]MBQ9392128.1 AAA family ATPase [Lachnospiraceae bacterium]
MSNKSTVIALAGKGGVGKTSLSAAIVRILTEEKKDKKILAIDADPAIGLSVALGVDVAETLDDIRLQVAKDVTEGLSETQDILAEAKFRLLDAMNEDRGFAFLAIGRPEAAGCYCAINTYLRQVISMLADEFDYVVIDGEAGIEQINRRVMEKVTHLLLVSDQSRKGIEIIKTIDNVSKELVMAEKSGAILNRILHPETLDESILNGIPLLSVIGADDVLVENDIEGMSSFELPNDARILQGARDALSKLGII